MFECSLLQPHGLAHMVFARQLSLRVFFFYCYGDHRDLHSFPTRRSSDLQDHEILFKAVLVATRATEPSIEAVRSEEHTSELQSRLHLVCRLLLEKKKNHTDSRAELHILVRRVFSSTSHITANSRSLPILT